jgi:hypothetical protein
MRPSNAAVSVSLIAASVATTQREKDIAAAALAGYDGPCGFCQRSVRPGLGSGNFAHPFRKIFLYICPGCRSKAEAHAAKIKECCFCGGSLTY